MEKVRSLVGIFKELLPENRKFSRNCKYRGFQNNLNLEHCLLVDKNDITRLVSIDVFLIKHIPVLTRSHTFYFFKQPHKIFFICKSTH